MNRQNMISLAVICVVLIGLGIALINARKDDDNPQQTAARGVSTTAGMTANDAMHYKTKTFRVSGTDDPLWQSTISSTVATVKGTRGVDRFDPAKGTVEVIYDPAVTNEDKIAAALDATKFKVQP